MFIKWLQGCWIRLFVFSFSFHVDPACDDSSFPLCSGKKTFLKPFLLVMLFVSHSDGCATAATTEMWASSFPLFFRYYLTCAPTLTITIWQTWFEEPFLTSLCLSTFGTKCWFMHIGSTPSKLCNRHKWPRLQWAFSMCTGLSVFIAVVSGLPAVLSPVNTPTLWLSAVSLS